MKGDIPFRVPAVMGHETSGWIVDTGSRVGELSDIELRTGQKVVVPFILPCGVCRECRRGQEEICHSFLTHNRGQGALYDGTSRLYTEECNERVSQYSQGGLAEFSVVPATSVFPVPDTIPLHEAAIIGCSVFTAWGAVRNAAQVLAGESAVVIGTGGVGQAIIQWLHVFGAAPIIAVDINEKQLDVMRSIGATHVVNASKVDVLKSILDLTDGRGVDVAFEALGKNKTFEQAFHAVCGYGRVIAVGLAPASVLAPVEINRLVRRQITVKGSYGAKARRDCPQILDFIHRGQFRLSQGVTQRVSLDNVNDAYIALDEGRSHGRTIVDFQMK